VEDQSISKTKHLEAVVGEFFVQAQVKQHRRWEKYDGWVLLLFNKVSLSW